MSEELWFERLSDGTVVQVYPRPYSWAEADAAWRRAVSGRNGVKVISIESFLNDCHWPWAVEGLRTEHVAIERGCGHPENRELKYSTTVDELLSLQRSRMLRRTSDSLRPAELP